MISQDYIRELTDRNDIVDVIQSYVQLRGRGRTHSGLCPFHNEKTPSFVVYPETKSFYCFGCGAGGDVIGFMKRIANLDYIEAVKQLASRVGMPMPDDDDQTGKLRSRILSINKDTAKFFYQSLNSPEGAEARRYWREKRQLTDGSIRRFGLGYAPDSFSKARDYLYSLGYNEEELLLAGVIGKSEKGSTYDFFRGRAMIPIFDLRGNVIAFSGRDFTSEKPQRKYVNSKETLVYKKSKTLFLMNFAKKSKSRRYILCEGNLDAISMHQAGFDTAVAGCGTALTPDQVRLLSDYADEVVLCYDSDEPGQKATEKAIGLFANSPIKISVLSLPGAKDPDEFIKENGAERFEMLLNNSGNAVEYELKKARDQYDIVQPDGRVNYIKDAIGVLSGRISPTERDVYIGRIAEETGVSREALTTQLASAVKTRVRKAGQERERRLMEEGAGGRINVSYTQGGQKVLGVAYAEQQLVGTVLKDPSLMELSANRVQPEQFISEDMKKVYSLLQELYRNGEAISLPVLASDLPEETNSLLSRILAQNYDVKPSAQDIEFYIQRIENSVPESARAGEKTPEELEAYMRTLSEKKGNKKTPLE